VDDVTHAEALARCVALAEERQPRYVVTPNPEFVVVARRDPELRRILNAADLSIPDGGGLLLAARLWGQPLREQVRGTDLVHLLAAVGAPAGQRWFLLGGAPGVAEAAARALLERYPGLQIAGTAAGSPAPADDAAARAAIRAAAPVDILLVAYGAPGQELWMARNLAALPVAVSIGVGGVLDYLAGRVRRAPAWVRGLGLEWLFRLLVQPWRWRRQLALLRFALAVLRELPRWRARARAAGNRPAVLPATP
jgi:N-acetylglucosaminyldiphosphoundecaprenol N-acetyl-beta-D-mannosaminyltransferase